MIRQNVTLRVTPGEGMLARREAALLYTPAADAAATLVDTFMEATDSADALADHLLECSFESPPFVMVDWSHSVLHLMVFGDVEVGTDHVSLPLLSGSSSQTWVEHRMHRSVTAAEVRLRAPSHSLTHLDAGVVPAGGFLLEWTAPADDSAAPATGGPEDDAAGTDDEAPADPEPPAAPEPVGFGDPVPVASVEAALGGDHVGADGGLASGTPPAPTPAVDPLDHTAALNAIQAASLQAAVAEGKAATPQPAVGPDAAAPPIGSAPVGDPAEPAAEAHDVLGLAPPLARDEDAPPPASARVDGPPPPPDARATVEASLDDLRLPDLPRPSNDDAVTHLPPSRPAAPVMVKARACGNGHLNDPDAVFCEVCGASLPRESDTIVDEVRPIFRQLRSSDGRIVPLDRDLVIGRTSSPNPEPGFFALTGEKVSRRHCAVTMRGWQVYVEDLGSRNGTTVVQEPGSPEVELDATTGAVPVDPGAVIIIDSQTFLVERTPGR